MQVVSNEMLIWDVLCKVSRQKLCFRGHCWGYRKQEMSELGLAVQIAPQPQLLS